MKALPDLDHQPSSLLVSRLPTEMPTQADTSSGSGVGVLVRRPP
jgi:hypothetical protein